MAAFRPRLEVDAFVRGVWETIDQVRTSLPVTIRHGESDWSGRSEPSQITLRVGTFDGVWSPSNLRSPHAGHFDVDTPVRVGVRSGESYLEAAGPLVLGRSAAFSSGLPGINIGSSADFRIEFEAFGPIGQASVLATSEGLFTLGLSRDGNGGPLALFLTFVDADGTGRAWSTQAGRVGLPESILLSPSALRVTLDGLNDVNLFPSMRVFVSSSGTNAGPWVDQRVDTLEVEYDNTFTADGVIRLLTNGLSPAAAAAPLRVKEARFDFGRAEPIRISFRGVEPFAANAPVSPAGTMTVEDGQIRNVAWRAHGLIASWKLGWLLAGTDSWVDITVSGLLRKLSHSKDFQTTRSAIRRSRPSADGIRAYWPMEGLDERSSIAEDVLGGPPLRLTSGALGKAAGEVIGSDTLRRVEVGQLVAELVPAPTADRSFSVTAILSIPEFGSMSVEDERALLSFAVGVTRFELRIVRNNDAWSFVLDTVTVDERVRRIPAAVGYGLSDDGDAVQVRIAVSESSSTTSSVHLLVAHDDQVFEGAIAPVEVPVPFGPAFNIRVNPRQFGPGGQGVNEVQRIAVQSDKGEFQVQFRGQSADNIPFNISSSGLQSRLLALSSFPPGSVEVRSAGTLTHDVEFVGPLGGQPIELLTRSGAPSTVERIVAGSVGVAAVEPAGDIGIGHVALYSPSSTDSRAFLAGFGGNRGEPAARRIARLCEESGVPIRFEADELGSIAMGTQPSAPLIDLLREAAKVDFGVLVDDPKRVGLLYRSGLRLLNQTPRFRSEFSAGLIGDIPRVTRDDQGYATRVVATGRDGGEGVSDLADLPDDGYQTVSATLNVDNRELLSPFAGMLARLSSSKQPRIPDLKGVLDSSIMPDELREVWRSLVVGDLVGVDRWPSFLGLADTSHIILGITEEIGTHTHRVSLNTRAGDVFMSGVADDTARYGVDGAETATVTLQDAVVVRVSSPVDWTVDALDYPMTVTIGGLNVTVGSARAVSPGVYDLGLTDSVDAIPVGSAVRLDPDSYYTL